MNLVDIWHTYKWLLLIPKGPGKVQSNPLFSKQHQGAQWLRSLSLSSSHQGEAPNKNENYSFKWSIKQLNQIYSLKFWLAIVINKKKTHCNNDVRKPCRHQQYENQPTTNHHRSEWPRVPAPLEAILENFGVLAPEAKTQVHSKRGSVFLGTKNP